MTIFDRSRSNTPEAHDGQVLRRDRRGNSQNAEPHEVGAPTPDKTSEIELPAPDYVDTNNRLVDELERILHGDFADRPDAGESGDMLSGDFPLAGDGFDVDEENAPFAPAYGDPRPDPTVLEENDEPPQGTRAGFWEANEPFIEERSRSDERINRIPIGRFTIATILLMVVAGGTYAYVQLTGDPVLPLSGGTEIAAASPLGGTPREAETVVVDPDPVALDPNEAAPVTEPEEAPAAEIEPPVETVQPRLVRTVPIPVPTAEAAIEAVADPTAETNEIAGLGGPLVEPDAGQPAALIANATPEIVPDPPPTPAEPATVEAGFDPAGGTPPATAAPSTTVVTTNDWVNLRAGPDNDAAVIQTVPFGAELQLVACDPWCEVYYEGTHGWIWRDFINAAP